MTLILLLMLVQLVEVKKHLPLANIEMRSYPVDIERASNYRRFRFV